MPSSPVSRAFGLLPTGEPVEAWTITGSSGLVVEILTYGGIISRLLVPGPGGKLTDVVLGFNRLEPYLSDRAYFGAVAGRVAGRITDASFALDGETYELARNDGPNHLHGGRQGFGKRLWSVAAIDLEKNNPSLRLTYRSPDGEEGYPGTVDVAVTYTVTEGNVLLIQSEAVSARATPLSLTFHSYFNLAGHDSGSIADHELQIHADKYVPTDEHMTLKGTLADVTSGNDFRSPRRIGDAIPQLFQSHGDLYRTREIAAEDAGRTLVPVARLVHWASRRAMEVSTTAPYLQVYTGAALDGIITGKSGVAYQRHAGICLECEEYPDGARVPAMGDIILRPGQLYSQVSTFTFCSLRSE